MPQCSYGLCVKQLARVGKRDGLTFVPAYQADAEVALEPLNLAAQRRLCNLQPIGRACEVQLFNKGDEITELTGIDHLI
ncbi:hypothetical protein B0G80_7419 [Paraburkholderia sp. BL6669N2]|nr:hypothetical protein B0G80_7419 [Paraburkholderia sp. BL6669N2]